MTRHRPSLWLDGLTALALLLSAYAPAGAAKKAGELDSGYERSPYLQSLTMDSVIVAWIASASGSPLLDYGTTLAYGETVEAKSNGRRRHVELRGLTPGTEYFYRVRAGDRILAEGPDYRFRTDEGPDDPTFSFLVSGDIGDKGGEQELTARSIRRADPLPEMGILVGDIVYNEGRSEDYDERLMRPWRDLFRNIPIWPALGNHDWKSSPKDNWRVEWYLPNNEHYYSFDYANAHFVALDTRDGDIYDRKNQVRWLQKDLEANKDADWTFVYFHHPAITCTYKENHETVIENFLPLFDRYRVDVVFAGHAHTYERLYPIERGRVIDREEDPHYVDPQGTIYIVSGAGAQAKRGKPTKFCGPTAFFRDETILWTHVVVEGPKCTIRTYESENQELVDEVTITKQHLLTLAPSN